MKISGIYTITNKIDGKIYVGQSVDVYTRLRKHKEQLISNKHINCFIQSSVIKYGIENFEFEILEECNSEYLYSQEHYWCNMLNTHNDKYGYNLKPTNPYFLKGSSKQSALKAAETRKRKGFTVSKETITKSLISRKLTYEKRGYYHNEETRQKISNKLKGKKKLVVHKHNEKSKKLMSEKAKIREVSQKAKDALKKYRIEHDLKPMLGKKHSEITKQKIKDARKNQDMSYCSKPILQYNLDGNLVKEWKSLSSVNKIYKVNIKYYCLKNKPFKNYVWVLKKEN